MASREGVSIFISYARKDGAELAARLHGDLTKRGFEVWVDTREIAGGDTWPIEIGSGIDQSQFFLALLTPGAYVSEICRAEQLRALRRDKCVIPILAQRGSEIPWHFRTTNYLDLTGKAYASGFKQLLRDIRARKGVALKPDYYVTAPPLPPNFVERPDELSGLRNLLVADGGRPSIALTALRGMGGIGKTVLAQALSHDVATQLAFPDGIIWTTAGKEPIFDL